MRLVSDDLRDRWRRTVTTVRAPRVSIRMYGSDDAKAFHGWFTQRHPRIRVTQSKKWGVALLPVPASLDEHLVHHTTLRKRRGKALRLGYTSGVVPPQDHIEEILAINHSLPDRQGRPMSEHYMDRDSVAHDFRLAELIHVVFDAQQRVRAYAMVRPMGDLGLITAILGHGDDLDNGIMYVLIAGVIGAAAEERGRTGIPKWLMYDTMWGATKGLAFFKERAGFGPYTVEWLWLDEPPDRSARTASPADLTS